MKRPTSARYSASLAAPFFLALLALPLAAAFFSPPAADFSPLAALALPRLPAGLAALASGFFSASVF
jgi:hypothetical protein